MGVLIGLAAGDRIGGPIRMAMRLAGSFADQGRFDPEDVSARYLAWWSDGGFDTGPTAGKVLELVSQGASFADAALRVHEQSEHGTAGCNPAHRTPPLAMLHTLADADLAEAAKHEAALTHTGPIAGDVAAAACVLCRQLIRGVAWPDALRIAQVDRLPATAESLEVSTEPTDRGGFAPAVLAASVWFVDGAAEFSEALEHSIDFAGPTNYAPVLVGAIAGARWGASAVPPAMLEHVDVLDQVRSVAETLSGEWV